ncbi:MAG: T9SS type A sorting domain-containing protein [Bacteroidetes bacterium]|nr:T9SS type A sorting domain-containing protein [Bacteroidota bacterium]
MKKFILFLIVITSLCANIFSQSKWTRIINSLGNQEEYSNSIAVDSLGNIYSTGAKENPLPRIQTIKLNSFGNLLWENVIPAVSGSWIGYSVVCRNNNSILVSGFGQDSSFILNFNSQGNLLKKYSYIIPGSYFIQVHHMIKTSNNKYLLCGRIDYTSGYAALINSDFSLAWQKVLTDTVPNNWRVTESGTFFNGYYYFIDDWDIPYLTKIDSLGNIIWGKPITYNGNYSRIWRNKIDVLNGRLLVAGLTGDTTQSQSFKTAFELIDENGIVMKKSIISNQNSEGLNDFQIYKNRIVYVSSIFNSSGQSSKASVNILDTNFNLLKTKPVLFNDYTELYSVQLNDSFYYFSGLTWKNSGTNQRSDILIIKTDSTLEIPPVGIKETNTFVSDFALHQNYPNPFNPSTKISYSLKKSSAIELKLFDINGRMIKIIESGFKPAGSYEINFSSAGLSSGVYFFSLYSEGILMDTKKAALMK